MRNTPVVYWDNFNGWDNDKGELGEALSAVQLKHFYTN